MKYIIAQIEHESIAEVKGHISDIIYFRGCKKNCCYCFNPELREYKEPNMTLEEIIADISLLSDTVVMTGGEPLHRNMGNIFKLNRSLKELGKTTVLETSVLKIPLWELFDKILYTIKTFRWKQDVGDWANLAVWRDNYNIDVCVVKDHDCFNKFGYNVAKKLFQNEIIERGVVNGDY